MDSKTHKTGTYRLPFLLLIIGFCLSACDKDEEALQFTIGGGTPAYDRTLRVITFNIREGMATDKANNFDNFVQWVQSYDPDVLAMQETNGFTEASLQTLAQRYGHDYVTIIPGKDFKIPDSDYNANYTPGQIVRDAYTPAITSRYPIEVRQTFNGTNVNHGAIFATINGINFICLHLTPTSQWQTKEAAEAFRTFEMDYYLENTLAKYQQETNWLMMGDFNSYPSADSAYYAKNYNWNFPAWRFETHRRATNAGYRDAIWHLHPYFQYTSDGDTPLRLDFIYASQALIGKVTRSRTLYDDFTKNYSDHCPVMVEVTY